MGFGKERYRIRRLRWLGILSKVLAFALLVAFTVVQLSLGGSFAFETPAISNSQPFEIAQADENAGSDVTYKIGVLAKRGAERALAQWGETASYLEREIPGISFEIVPLNFQEIYKAVEKDTIDFVVANSGMYVDFEATYGANRIATLKNLRLGNSYTKFGGVILRRSDRNDIQDLSDLKGKTFAAVSETSLGGWLMAWRELKAVGIDPQRNLKELSFLETHDKVVLSVQNQEFDAGTVRTDTLERMAAEGKIDLNDFTIINQQDTTGEDFPFALSTRLYPEWPFAANRNTPIDVSEKVADALLRMPSDSLAAKQAKIEGWTIPFNYRPVHECFIELEFGPYESIGAVTFGQIIQRFWYWAVVIVAFVVLAAIAFISQQTSLRQRRRAEGALQELNESLAASVGEKESALEAEQQKNERLQGALLQMSELRASSEDVANQAEIVNRLSQEVLKLVNRGSESVGNTLEQIQGLEKAATTMQGQAAQLLDDSRQIEDIASVVSDLSEQTHLLALNAAVEAARAGERGDGFSIVAAEVRQLANQSRSSAEKIRSLISQTGEAIQATANASDRSAENADKGVKIARDTSDALQGVQEAIDAVVDSAQTISLSTRQQASVIQQVVDAINAVQDLKQSTRITAS